MSEPVAKPAPPMLPGLPLIGNILDFARGPDALFAEGYRAHGPVFGVQMGGRRIAVLIGPELHQFFFTETDKRLNISKPYVQLAAMFGQAGFLAPKEVYRDQHPVLYSPFKPEKMGRYVQVMQREVQRWLDSLGEAGVMDITAEMNQLVQEIAGYALMGEDFQQRMGREFWNYYSDLGQKLNVLLPPDWPLPNNIQRDRLKAKIRAMIEPVLEERRRNPDAYDDMLQQFLETPTRSGGPADNETVIALMMGLLFASHETTAGQAAWTVIELLRNPEYQALVHTEIERHLPRGAALDARSMRALEHVYWAVHEVERLHPSANMLMRVADEPIDVGDYQIPAGWTVLVSAGVAHRLPQIFKDPERFDPLRYAPGREEDRKHGYSLIGFGGGRHKCAGMNFANNEMMVITALLFQQFELELLTPNPGTAYGRGAVRPDRALIRYRRRSAPAPQPEEEAAEALA
ncbi:MAG TPA: cytochrome P450 [Roseiflexaceae bacterium]|nr:cytochrome P450 [Roseiflexaceae bacterium]